VTSERISTFVGNDIIDLASPRLLDRAADPRLWDRVLAPSERGSVEMSDDPPRAFLCHWAAKEAGFKAVSKAAGAPPVFEHRSFVVELADGSDGGVLRYRGTVCKISLESAERTIHALAWTGEDVDAAAHRTRAAFADPVDPSGPGGRIAPALTELLHPEERATIHSAPSAWVRILAREALAGATGQPKEAIAILGDPDAPGRAPPRLRIEGLREVPDLSLSHHGRFVAWAFLLSRSRTQRIVGR
jgi:phosphopantetheinyl transferase (holo-ACP synthase)